NRLGVFPALAFAWKLNNEKFMENVDFVDDLKLRITYGETGNDRIDATATQFLFSATTNSGPGVGNIDNVYYTTSSNILFNTELKWEIMVTNNIRLDYTLFNHRLRGSLDYYKNETRDLLLASAIPNNT